MTNRSGISILAIDDEHFMLLLLERMLGELGYSRLRTSSSGLAALQMMGETGEVPDVVLLDINMPGLDGIEFVRRLVELRYGCSLILVSGEDERTQQATEQLARAHGVVVLGHVHKPVSREGLVALLDKWQPSQPGESRSGRERKKYSAEELRSAMENGELINYYQPKVQIATGKMVGVETLVRWEHPQDGLVMPSQFVDVAEAHGMIGELTWIVLTAALEQAKAWQQAGLELTVAVNLSMDNLDSLGFLDKVMELADKAGVAPQSMELEVTETRLMRDLPTTLEVLARLRLKRFRLSIDDFGTGNSSLAQLRDLPFDELKIDQSFVHGAASDERLRAIFDSSIVLARQLGMDAVAEGVADYSDWEFVKQRECDIAQGYYIAEPMPAIYLPGWALSWQTRAGQEYL